MMEIYRAAELIGKAQGEFEKLSPLIKMQAGAVLRPLMDAQMVMLKEIEELKNKGAQNGQ